MKKKLLSLLLVLIMALSLLPTAVFAQDDEASCDHSWNSHGVCEKCFATNDSHQCEPDTHCEKAEAPNEATGHYSVCQYCYKKIPGTLADHLLANGVCVNCGYVDEDSHECVSVQGRSEGGHWRYCIYCLKTLTGTEVHTFENGVCSVCKYPSADHKHTTGDIFLPWEGGHVAMCVTCEATLDDTVLPHRWDDNGVCKDCWGVDEARHTHSFDGEWRTVGYGHKSVCATCHAVYGDAQPHLAGKHYSYTETGHKTECKLCYASFGGELPHELNDNGECKECDYLDLAKHTTHTHSRWEPVEGGHMSWCNVCNQTVGTVEPHEYDEYYVCKLCLYPDPDHHEHAAGGGYLTDSEQGHKDICLHCGRDMGEWQKHTFERECCTVCGEGSPDHTHIYFDVITEDDFSRVCAICKHQFKSAGVVHEYENGVCKDCGYLDPSLKPTAIRVGTNANREMTLTLTFANAPTRNLTVTGFEYIPGEEEFSFGNTFTKEGIILGECYGLGWNEKDFVTVAYGKDGEPEVMGNYADAGSWWDAYYYAQTHGVALPTCHLVNGVWQITGTGFDGKPISKSISDKELSEYYGHTLVKQEAVKPTCSTAGSEEHYLCTVCGRHFRDVYAEHELTGNSWVIAPTGLHAYENGKCKTCGFVNPVANVKKDDLKTDTKNDKIVTDNKGLVIKSESKIDETVVERIKEAVDSGHIAIAVDNNIVADLGKTEDGGLQALNKAAENTADTTKKEELKKVADTLQNARKDDDKKNVQIETVLDVAVQLMHNGDAVGQIIELPEPITVQVPISEELYTALQGKKVVVIRSHTDANGSVTTDELPATLGGEEGSRYVSFQTDKASTFALMSYENAATPAVKTGDAGITLWLITLPVTALAAAAVVIGRKKSEAK